MKQDFLLTIVSFITSFDDPDYFYYLRIIKRKKDNPDVDMTTSKTIKSYCIDSFQELLDLQPEITRICDVNNARAMLYLNKRSYKSIAMDVIKKTFNHIEANTFQHIKNAYDMACISRKAEKKYWIIDIDEVHNMDKTKLHDIIDRFRTKKHIILPTKTGIHLIVEPFDPREFKKEYPHIEIHKDSPINLYIPKFKTTC